MIAGVMGSEGDIRRQGRDRYSGVGGSRAFLTECMDQRHKFFRPFRVVLGVNLRVFLGDLWFENDACREPQVIPPLLRSFCPCGISILGLALFHAIDNFVDSFA
jgi:hypothetical protein